MPEARESYISEYPICKMLHFVIPFVWLRRLIKSWILSPSVCKIFTLSTFLRNNSTLKQDRKEVSKVLSYVCEFRTDPHGTDLGLDHIELSQVLPSMIFLPRNATWIEKLNASKWSSWMYHSDLWIARIGNWRIFSTSFWTKSLSFNFNTFILLEEVFSLLWLAMMQMIKMQLSCISIALSRAFSTI